MDLQAVAVIGGGALAQLSLGRWVASPWLVPDLILVSVILAMARRPDQSPMGPGILGGLFAMAGTLHEPCVTVLAYLGTAWLVKGVASRVDFTDPAIQLAVVGCAETMLLGVWALSGASFSEGMIIIPCGTKLLVTVACVPVVRWLVARVA